MNNDRTEEINMTVGETGEVDFEVVSSTGTSNYERLANKPSINSVELVGDKTSEELGLQPAGEYLTDETDPIFSASASATITSEDITSWNNKSEFSGNYNDLTNKPDLSNYITKDVDNLTNYTKTSGLSSVATSGSYNDLSNKPAIPSKTSDLSNDSGFINKDVNNLTNYYKTSDVYTKTEVDNKVSSVYKFKGSVASYSNLPSTGLTVGDTYNTTDTGMNYAWTGSIWDSLGSEIDLSNYQTKIDSTHKLSSDLVDDSNNTNKFVTASDKTTWSGKQDALISGTNIKTINNESILGSGNINIQGGGGESTDVQINGVSITSSGTANIITEGTYNASTNKIATKSDIPTTLASLSDDSTHRLVTDTEKNTWDAKGTYSKPSGGIPSTDMSSAVQTSLGKADTALQSFTESDPVFTASDAYGITSTDISNWNAKSDFSGSYNDLTDKPTIPTVPTNVSAFTNDAGYTTNTGTITSVKMNGSTVSSSGEADLGTVITSHQDISGKLDTSAVKTSYNTTQGNVYDVTYINSTVGNIETLLSAI